MPRQPPRSPLFPYPTLFRSLLAAHVDHHVRIRLVEGVDVACRDRKSTRLNSSHLGISYAVFCLKKMARIAGASQTKPYDSGRTTFAGSEEGWKKFLFNGFL